MAKRPREGRITKTMTTITRWLASLVSTARAAAAGVVTMLMILMCSGTATASPGIEIDRRCAEISITVTAPAAGSYELLGYREFGEEPRQTATWAARYDAGERITWRDKSYSTVTYRLVRGHASNPRSVPADQLAAGPVSSVRSGCK